MEKLLEETATRVMIHEKYFDMTTKCFSRVVTNLQGINRKMRKTDMLLMAVGIFVLVNSFDKTRQIEKLRKEVENLKGSAEVEEKEE